MEAIRINDFCKAGGYIRSKVDALRKKMGIKAKLRADVWSITSEEASALDRELSEWYRKMESYNG
jgi:hypothetical protein